MGTGDVFVPRWRKADLETSGANTPTRAVRDLSDISSWEERVSLGAD